MSHPVIERAVHTTREWLAATVAEAGMGDEERAWRALRATLHALRDRLPPNEAVQLAAQLPMLLRGLYFEGWRPNATPVRAADRDAMLAAVHASFPAEPREAAEHIVRSVFRVLVAHVSPGEIAEVKHALSESLSTLWPRIERAEVRRPAPPRPRASFSHHTVAALSYGHGLWEPRAERLWQGLVRRTGALAARRGLAPIRLHASVERAEDGRVGVRVTAETPVETLRADHVDDTLLPALGRVFERLHGVMDGFLTRHQPAFHALVETRRRALAARALAARAKPVEDGWRQGLIVRALAAVQRAAQHEVAILQAEGVVAPGQLDPGDLVDEVIADMLPLLTVGMDAGEVAFRMQDRVHERAVALAAAGDGVEEVDYDGGVDSVLEGGARSELSRELYEFRVVDEEWRLHEVVSDPDAQPIDEIVAVQEARHVLINALFHLPDEDRRVFAAVVVDGLGVQSVAAARGEEESAVAHRVSRASRVLAERLWPGMAGGDTRAVEVYDALGRLGRDEAGA